VRRVPPAAERSRRALEAAFAQHRSDGIDEGIVEHGVFR
jgi:hypothetical protein